MDSNRSCRTCAHFHDDGSCHRYPPSAPVFKVTYNGVPSYMKTSEDGSAMLAFPTVVENDVCGEYAERTGRGRRFSEVSGR